MRHRVAVVTGASSGIGEALAAALAGRGIHVVVVARTTHRLESLKARIEADGGKATVLSVDLAVHGAAEHLVTELEARGLEVDLLVNNAGFGFFGGFESEAPQHLADMLRVNVVALTELSRLLVPALLARRGTILNVASTVAFQPTPFMAAYGATKSFVLSLSEALWAEYRSRGLHVVAVCPGPVETPFIERMGSAVRSTAIFRNALSADDVVGSCLAALESSRPTHVVGLRNWLLAQTARFSPRALTARVGAVLFAPPKTALSTRTTGALS